MDKTQKEILEALSGIQERLEKIEQQLDLQNNEFSIQNFVDGALLQRAVNVVIRYKKATPSFIQSKLKIGYGRAAMLIIMMEEKGMIGPDHGDKPRKIYIGK